MIKFYLAAIFAILVVFVLICVICADYNRTKAYKNSLKAQGTVVCSAGTYSCSNYGKYQSPTNYFVYTVEYSVNGIVFTGNYYAKEDSLVTGDKVEVHYAIDDNGNPKILNRDISDRFSRFALSIIIGIPFIAALLYLKNKGYLD